jgi:hypothetical protein
MTVQAEIGKLHVFNGVAFEEGEPINLNAETFADHQGALVAVQRLDESGERPLKVSATDSRQALPPKEDVAGWEEYLARRKTEKDLVDAPFVPGILEPHGTSSHFTLAPVARLEVSSRTSGSLFQFGRALVVPLVELSV